MAYWAEVDDNNIVIRVTVGDNEDPNGDEGYQWLINNLGGRWIKTSYNRKIRKHYASVGFIYDELRDAFLMPQPFPSWVLDEDTCDWQAPIVYPTDGNTYNWDETAQKWQLTDFS